MDIIIYIFISAAIIFFIHERVDEHKRFKKGREGEENVIKHLNKLPKRRYRVINDVMLKTPYGTTQIDHVVVSIYGIFVIETKNYGGCIYGTQYGEQWMQVIGGKKYFFYNPLKQNYGHMKGLKMAIDAYDECFIPVVAFSDRSTLKLDVDEPVVYAKELSSFIKSHKEIRLTIEEADTYFKEICTVNVNSKAMKKRHSQMMRMRGC